MARVKGPLMSASATGSIGRGLVQFRMTRHGPQALTPALTRPAQPQPPSSEQRLCRNDVRELAAAWSQLDPGEQATYAAIADRWQYPNGWSAYLSAALPAVRNAAHTLTTADGRALITAAGFRLRV